MRDHGEIYRDATYAYDDVTVSNLECAASFELPVKQNWTHVVLSLLASGDCFIIVLALDVLHIEEFQQLSCIFFFFILSKFIKNALHCVLYK